MEEPTPLPLVLTCTDSSPRRTVWCVHRADDPDHQKGALYFTNHESDCVGYPGTTHMPELAGVMDPAVAWALIESKARRGDRLPWVCQNCGTTNDPAIEFYRERAEACGDDPFSDAAYSDTCGECFRGVFDVRRQPLGG